MVFPLPCDLPCSLAEGREVTIWAAVIGLLKARVKADSAT